MLTEMVILPNLFPTAHIVSLFFNISNMSIVKKSQSCIDNACPYTSTLKEGLKLTHISPSTWLCSTHNHASPNGHFSFFFYDKLLNIYFMDLTLNLPSHIPSIPIKEESTSVRSWRKGIWLCMLNPFFGWWVQ